MSDIQDKTVIQKKTRSLSPDVTRVAARASVHESSDSAHSSAVANPSSRLVQTDSPENATVVASRSKKIDNPPHQVVGTGCILKRRFELTALLGSGGMGSVYKARDLRQVEAGDKSPWVAVKVINESFARHEHALITLQQETKKTQRLAHPNIVSVYDFDREGGVAFMTMELLEGQSLDSVIARKPGGLPVDEALAIMRQICLAVGYAHKQGIVHADLKPANIFLTAEGRVKILDFGIAQAMQSDGSFDAQVLNALTPAYASVSMLSGQRPQTVDDLYALGCIFYLLLTGKHPFNRKRATEADAAGLKPTRVNNLKSHQWRALTNLLQFQPVTDATIEAFQNAFFNEQDSRVRTLYQRVGVAAVVLVLVAVGINGYLNRSVRQLSQQLTSTDFQTVQKAASDIQQISGSDKVVVLERARDDVADRIEQRLGRLKTALEFQQLDQYLRVMGLLYPDSSRVQDSIIRFREQRGSFVTQLVDQLQQRIDKRDFSSLPISFAQQVQDLQTVSPDDNLLQGDSLKSLLAKEAGVAVYLGQREKARDILDQADQLFPQDAQRFSQIRQRLERSTRVAKLTQVNQGSNTHNQLAFGQARDLLQQFDLAANPDRLADYLQALSKVNESLYFVLRQGLKDFIAQQQQQGNGKAYTGLSQKLFGKMPVVALVQPHKIKPDPCSIRFANLGKQRGYRCRDRLTAKASGPELVVIKAGGLAPFAITRNEISIDDFNLYCTLYRRCKAQPASTLPITNIDLQQARFYSQWLSKMSGYEYRLPSLKEWQAAARDDSGVSDHNCVVNVSGRIVRGNSLRPVIQGYANELGLQNAFGNAEEWVLDGSSAILAGGAADVDIALCNAGYRNEKAPEAAMPFRGLRLVRELKTR